MEPFSTKNTKNRIERDGPFLTKNTKNGTERHVVLWLKMEGNGTEQNKNGTIGKKERERNDLAEGPCSRTERNEFKKSERGQSYK